MKTKPKLLVFDQIGYAEPFQDIFTLLTPNTEKDLVKGIKECDVVLFTGGADVSPHLYGEKAGPHTHAYPARDRFEEYVWHLATSENKGILGICRGLQLGCVMSGGKLIQHTTGHAGGSHLVEDMFGNTFLMTSIHHQMVRPETTKSVVVGWSKHRSSSCYLNGENHEIYSMADKEKVTEAEIVWFPDSRCLGIQGHPEASSNKNLHKYCQDLVKCYLLDEANVPKYSSVV